MFLRGTYSTVYVTTDRDVLDMHADYVAGGGHSEHALFVKSLQTKDGHRQVRCGPVNSRPNKKTQGQGEAVAEIAEHAAAIASQVCRLHCCRTSLAESSHGCGCTDAVAAGCTGPWRPPANGPVSRSGPGSIIHNFSAPT